MENNQNNENIEKPKHQDKIVALDSLSLGIMMPGEYTFGTNEAEHMEIISGKVEILIACGDSNWETINGGEYFEVPANCSFEIKVLEITDYCCTYLA